MVRSLLVISFLVFFWSCQSNKLLDASNATQIFQVEDVDFSAQESSAWSFTDNGLIGEGGSGYLISTDRYTDFILTLQFNPDKDVNSGVFIRCPNGDVSATGCYEINIWDDHTNQDFRTGAIVTHGKPLVTLYSVNQWNDYKIKAKGNRIEVWLNGEKTADLRDDKSSNGHIALQVLNGTVQFRNVFVKRL